nr:MAG TPA: hypothetical protein [Microviridae sp.]
MKANYYELQVYVPQKGYTTVYCYVGNRSNANRKFRSLLLRTPSLCTAKRLHYSLLLCWQSFQCQP